MLNDSETLHRIPEKHCLQCHSDYYDGRIIIAPGYLNRLFEGVK